MPDPTGYEARLRAELTRAEARAAAHTPDDVDHGQRHGYVQGLRWALDQHASCVGEPADDLGARLSKAQRDLAAAGRVPSPVDARPLTGGLVIHIEDDSPRHRAAGVRDGFEAGYQRGLRDGRNGR